MSSPRKFAEKIALLQQKQAEGDAAFKTIIYEVEAAKQRAEHTGTKQIAYDVNLRKSDKSFHDSNGFTHSNNQHFVQTPLGVEHTTNGSEQLLQLPDNTSWRRTHSDSSLHQNMMPVGSMNYNARLGHENMNQLGNYTVNEVKFDLEPYPSTPQYSTVPMQVSYSPTNFAFHPNNTQFDVNNNNHNYVSDQLNTNHTLTSAPIGTIQQQNLGSSPNQSVHMPLTARYSIGNGSPNVLMLPPNHSSRGGGSLPDLRSGNYNQYQAQSFSTISTPGAGPFNTTQGFFNAPLPQQTAEVELLNLAPQRQLPSSIGPLKQSPVMRRRHSPIGDIKPTSPRRRNSPSPDVSSRQNHQGVYRVEPSSPQSQSSYSPQNSPHLLPSPTTNDMNAFSPQPTIDNQQHQSYSALPTHFDRITLDSNHVYNQAQTSPPSQTQSSSMNPGMNNGNTNNYYPQNDFFSSYMPEIPANYNQSSPSAPLNNNNHNNSQRSPTIPNIILTGVDSSKLDLTNVMDNLIDPNDLNFDSDDFFLSTDERQCAALCDDTFSLGS